jgi:hypothetical protein
MWAYWQVSNRQATYQPLSGRQASALRYSTFLCRRVKAKFD